MTHGQEGSTTPQQTADSRPTNQVVEQPLTTACNALALQAEMGT